VDDNRVPRLDTTTGDTTPVALQSSDTQIGDKGANPALTLNTSQGNSRGIDSVDLQVNRTANTQVASGLRSFIGSGEKNTASSTDSVVCGGDSNVASTSSRATICGGQLNTATGQESFIGAGQNNTASNTQAVVAGGDTNLASGNESAVLGGNSNQATNTQAAVGGGVGNVASGAQTTISGGANNAASQPFATVPGGYYGVANHHGQLSRGAGQFAAPGDAQAISLIWRLSTASGAPNKPMFLDGTSLLATIATNSVWAFSILVVGRSTGGGTSQNAAWKIEGSIKNNAGTVALVSAVTTTLIANDTAGVVWGVVGNVVVEADNTNKALNIRVAATVDPLATTRWVAEMRAVELAF
jgi:hypothetical protein